MSFVISALPSAPFAPLFELSDTELAERGAVRRIADKQPGFPCRISLRDVEPGAPVLLVHYEHQTASSPFRASHAIYVSRTDRAEVAVDEVPEMLRSRLLSVRAFDRGGMLIDADVTDGRTVELVIARMLDAPEVEYLHLHFAKPGCYAARVDRA
jgi:hypothetical protein